MVDRFDSSERVPSWQFPFSACDCMRKDGNYRGQWSHKNNRHHKNNGSQTKVNRNKQEVKGRQSYDRLVGVHVINKVEKKMISALVVTHLVRMPQKRLNLCGQQMGLSLLLL